MSSPPRGFEPPAPEDLGQRSLAELREMLKRQARLLRNEKFICRLPDNGKKIIDSVAKLKAAIAKREEVRGKSELYHPVSLDCQLKREPIAVDANTGKTQNSGQILDTSSLVPGFSSVDNITSPKTTLQQQGLVCSHKSDEEAPEVGDTVTKCPASSSRASTPFSPEAREPEASERLLQPRVMGQAEDNSSSSNDLFIDRLQRITIADPSEHHPEENMPENLTGLRSETQRKPHYMEVLDLRAKNPVPPLRRFKTNMLPSRPNGSYRHQQTRGSPISSEERRRRDKQHLDDITAARLLPLHHMPTQLLSIEESLALQQQQKQSYEELQAKLAAQKLAERLNIKMQSYNPEGETSRKYREVRDEDDGQSSDDES